MMDSIDHGVKDDDYDNISNYAPNLDDAIDDEYAERTAYIKKISLENAELKALLKKAGKFIGKLLNLDVEDRLEDFEGQKAFEMYDKINKAIGDKE